MPPVDTLAASMDRPFALWLVPVEDQARLFTAIIRDLAQRFGTPDFPPHVTLCSGNLITTFEDGMRRMDRLSAEQRSLSLAVTGIGLTDNYFSFLFITLAEIDFPTILGRALQIFPEGHNSSIGPHLSLMYGDQGTPIDRTRVRAEIRDLLPERVWFDTIQMVIPRGDDWHDVAGWDIRYQVPLAPPG